MKSHFLVHPFQQSRVKFLGKHELEQFSYYILTYKQMDAIIGR